MTLLQTSVSPQWRVQEDKESWAGKDKAGGFFSGTSGSESTKLPEAVHLELDVSMGQHSRQLRTVALLTVIVYAIYSAMQCCGLGTRLYCMLFEDGKGLQGERKVGMAKLLMQFMALTWKNVITNSRSELPMCCRVCNGCCIQMLCPVLYIFLLTTLPLCILKLTGADQTLVTEHPWQWARDYRADDLRLSPSMGDLLFQPPSLLGLADVKALKQLMSDPLVGLWHPPGVLPQGACFCRTLGIVGPRAADFQYFANQSYQSWVRGQAHSLSGVMGLGTASMHCPSNTTGTLFRIFSSVAEANDLIGRYDYHMVRRERSVYSPDRLCGLVVFENDPLTSAVPRFQVRTNVTGSDSSGRASLKRVKKEQRGQDKASLAWYLQSGFLPVQDMVQRYVLQARLGDAVSLPTPSFAALPTAPYHWDEVKNSISAIVSDPGTPTTTYMVTVMLIAYFMIRERNTRQKELMRLMGLYDSSLALSWVALFGLMGLVCSLGCSFMVYATIIEKSDFLPIFLIFFLTFMASITFGMVISSLFSSERLGALLAFAAYHILGLIYHLVVPGGSMIQSAQASQRMEECDPSTLYWASIFPNIAFTLCLKTLFEMDKMRIGCTWKHINTQVGKYTVGKGLGMLVLDCFIWGLLHVYLEQVIPHQVGSTRPWYFPFLPSYWRDFFGCNREDATGQQSANLEPTVQEGKLFESEDSAQLEHLRRRNAIIAVRGLHKTFVNASGAEIRAVNGLNLTMYEGECFCLLGHNGAGKTTAMGMITGMLTPTAGEVSVIGYQMPEEKTQARAQMGFCMQQNVLWDTLTVKEHVILFASLMGLGPSAAEESCNTVLSRVELKYKQNAPESALSGGMKRKLNVALALVGDARVLLLDEPTAGMDPHTRRRLWGVLKQSRAERIMCLTTHYMDEADELGDRVAIMVHGKSACCGTNGFLKQRLGCGYMLNFVKVQEDVQNEPIEEIVRKHCGQESCREASAVGRELRLQVPFESAKHFPALMRDLDDRLAALGLESYGVGVSDLEDVFLRVANGDLEASEAGATPTAAKKTHVVGEGATRPTPKAEPTIGKQFVGLFQRRVRYGFRDSRMFGCQLLVPSLIMVVFLGMTKTAAKNHGDFDSQSLTTAGWPSNAHTTGPLLVSVGVGPGDNGTGMSWARGWQQGDMPGVSDIAFNSSVASMKQVSVIATLPQQNYQRWMEEVSFAHWAYRLAYGPKEQQYNQSNAEQFGGFLYSGNRVTIYPNTSASFAAPVLLNMHFTAAMRSAKPKGAHTAPERMEIVSQPFQTTRAEKHVVQMFTSFGMGLIIMGAYSFIATGIAAYIVMEKEMDVKHQLMVSGANRTAYWLSNFAFDSIFGLFSFVSTLIILAIFGASTWLCNPEVQATVLLLLLFVPAVCAYGYFWSHFFSTSGSALVGVLLFGIFIGSLGIEISHALMFFEKARRWGYILMWATRALVPSACVGEGLLYLAANHDMAAFLGVHPFAGFIFQTELCPPHMGGRCMVGAGDDIAMLIIDTIGYIVLFVIGDWISEHPAVAKWFTFRSDPICPWELRRQEDDKVLAEKRRVAGLDPASQVLMVSNVSKVYRSSKGDVHAVRGVSFAVDAGHVFGLLGTNGAGKTTTFKMICGQVAPSSGSIYVKGMDVAEDLHGVRRHIGYCPQFDALLDLMTVREHLELYARIKGFTGADMEAEMRNKLETMQLAEYSESRAGQLSGGNKRKLSTAIALIGEPDVIFLDEPSAGMDPLARRRMWDVIQTVALRRRSSAVVLTTHSMEEADALCTRIGIQCSGQLRCLGSPQQLKEWYGTGLELNLRMEAPTHKDSEALCREWEMDPEKICHVSKAKQLVSDFFARRRLADRAPPMAGKADTMAMTALAEWCLQEERSEELSAFLVDVCGGQEHTSCVERSAGSLRYKLTGGCSGGGPCPYGKLFETLEQHRDQYRLADFQLSQGTLEQTFNRLATEDMAMRGEDESDTEGQDGK